MFKEFKTFVLRGNVMDMAVGIIIGAGFGKIISSFVSDILMPPIGLLLGKVDFSGLFISLSGVPYASLVEAKKAGAPTINYGLFMNTVIDFIIVALAVFMVLQSLARLKRKELAAPTTKDCPFCLLNIPSAAKKCGHCTSVLASP